MLFFSAASPSIKHTTPFLLGPLFSIDQYNTRTAPESSIHSASAAHRTKRPWQGAEEKGDGPKLPQYDPKCYLCPGNERATGGKNDKYESTFVSVQSYLLSAAWTD